MGTHLILDGHSIKDKIHLIRGLPVMLDADLAKLYEVSTKRLNEQVKRNKYRFPIDLMFQLTLKEKTELVAKCDHFKSFKQNKSLLMNLSISLLGIEEKKLREN